MWSRGGTEGGGHYLSVCEPLPAERGWGRGLEPAAELGSLLVAPSAVFGRKAGRKNSFYTQNPLIANNTYIFQHIQKYRESNKNCNAKISKTTLIITLVKSSFLNFFF